MKKDFTNDELRERIFKSLNAIAVNAEINEYTREQVALGLKKSGDKISVDEFISATGLKVRNISDISGEVLDEGGVIREGIEDKCTLEFFNYQMSCIFQNCPMKNKILDFDDDGLMTFDDDTGEYIKSCFPLFKQVITTQVKYDCFDLIIPYSRQIIWQDRKKCIDFLEAVKHKKLQVGMNVGRFFGVTKYVPYFVRQLIEKNKRKFVLKCNDINDINYKLALFSVFDFKSLDNIALMELKCKAVAGV